MDSAAEKAFDRLCSDFHIDDEQRTMVRHGWVAALNWRCSAPSASGNNDYAAALKNIHAFILDGGLVNLPNRVFELKGLLERLNAAKAPHFT